MPKLLSVPLGLLSALFLKVAMQLPSLYEGFVARQSVGIRSALLAEGIQGLITTLTVLFVFGIAVSLAGAIIGYIRKSWALNVVRYCYIAVYVLAFFLFFAIFRITNVVFEAELSKPQPTLDAIALFYWRWQFIWRILSIVIATAIFHVLSWRRVFFAVYTGDSGREPGPGDVLLENLRSHGREPQFRKSILSSAFLHFAVIIMIPLIAAWFKGGCVDPYHVPHGSGEPVVVSMVRMVQPKKQPERRRIFNPLSSILFHEPDFDTDSDVQQEVEEQTQLTWVADPSSVHGKMGAGGGTKGGWPDGMKDGVVRFIVLEYNGEDWDNGMDAVSRAYVNFLTEFHRVTGFRVSNRVESHPISSLANYPKGRAPPFVFMTGFDRINVSQRDIKILREYILDGGMLFANCGGVRWHRNFITFMQVLFPGEPLLVVSDDDPIYQYPYTFTSGAPPFWHLGGYQALGIKRGNRWVVYYHPGDIKDAWKTGHSGLRPQLAKQGFQLGINVVYHAFTHYMDITRKYRR